MPSAVTVSTGLSMPSGMAGTPGGLAMPATAMTVADATARARSAPLIWTGVFLAAMSGTVFVTANVVTGVAGHALPVAINLALTSTGVVSTLIAIAAQLHHRIDTRLNLMSQAVVAHLDDVSARLDELESATSERALDGFIMPNGHTSVVPFLSRGARVSYLRDPR
jgi:hypothetical protein